MERFTEFLTPYLPPWHNVRSPGVHEKCIDKTSNSTYEQTEEFAAGETVKCEFRSSSRFGTPGFPSPLDRLRMSKPRNPLTNKEKLGSSWTNHPEPTNTSNLSEYDPKDANQSFDTNQSFPKVTQARSYEEIRLGCCKVYNNSGKTINKMANWTPDSYCGSLNSNARSDTLSMCNVYEMSSNEHSYSFSSCGTKGSFRTLPGSHDLHSLSKSKDVSVGWSGRKYIGGPESGAHTSMFTNTVINPNKAVLCLDSKGDILTSNNMASQLLEFAPSELIGLNFYNDILIHKKGCQNRTEKGGLEALGEVELAMDDERNGGVLVNGEVVDVITKDEKQLSLSLWLKALEIPNATSKNEISSEIRGGLRQLAILEPVEQRVGSIRISADGNIISMDYESRTIFQSADGVANGRHSITKLIPNFEVEQLQELSPVEKLKINLTGKTTDGIPFPLAMSVQHKILDVKADNINEMDNSKQFIVTVWVYSNISGLMLISEGGVIETCNPTFIHLLLGYKACDVIGKCITDLIPEFYSDIDLDEAKKLDFADLEEEIPVIEKGLDEMNFAEKYENQIENVNSKIDLKGILVDSSNRTDSQKRKVKTRLDFSNGLSNAPDPVNKSLGTGGRMSKESERINKENNRDLIEQFDDISNKENMSSNESLFEDGLILGDENVRKLVTSTPAANSINVNRRQNSLKKSEHTPSHHKDNIFEFPEGSFFGLGRHCDGSEINIMYQIRKLNFGENVTQNKSYQDSDILYALWISRDPEEPAEGGKKYGSLTLTSTMLGGCSISSFCKDSLNGSKKSLGQEIIVKCSTNSTEDPKKSFVDEKSCSLKLSKSMNKKSLVPDKLGNNKDCHDPIKKSEFHPVAKYWQAQIDQAKLLDVSNIQCQTEGTYEDSYQTLDQIGKGAFGCVKTAIRIQDQRTVVTKFIKKKKIKYGRWKNMSNSSKKCKPIGDFIEDTKFTTKNNISANGCTISDTQLPEEINILLKLNHPNIITILDVHENEHYFQMVMDHHGEMDLFEFIDLRHRNGIPNLGHREPLESHIFGQVVSAVDYLQNTMNILHRDIKDENVIIDQHFHIKLIDFGSATHYVPASSLHSNPSERTLFSTFYGTVEYCAPEVLVGEKYAGPELEMWSLGVLLYILLFGEHPFFDIEETIRCDVVGIKIPFELSSQCTEVLTGLLVKDPKRRMAMDILITQPWINQGCEMADIINSLRLEDVLNVNYRRTDGQPSKGDLDEKYELICD